MIKESIPKMKRKITIGAAETGDEVIFECADGTFSSIGTMDARGHELKIDVFIAKKLFQGSRALVV